MEENWIDAYIVYIVCKEEIFLQEFTSVYSGRGSNTVLQTMYIQLYNVDPCI